jgi:protein-disulfide isomerase
MIEEPKETTDEVQEDERSGDPGYVQIPRTTLYLGLIPVALLVGLGAGYLLWGQESNAEPDVIAVEETSTDTSQVGRLAVDPGDDPFLGPVDAPVTIVEFSDFSCPYCQRWHQEISQDLFEAFPDQIRFVYKDFPVVGGGRVGFLAAQAAHCAGEQVDYWEYHDAMFSGNYALESDGVDQAAVDLGLDLDSFKECMVEARYADEVREDFEYGASLGISSTPTFFINGIPMVGAQPLLNFVEVINSELSN